MTKSGDLKLDCRSDRPKIFYRDLPEFQFVVKQ
jgi:hypothetical protein